MTRDQGVFVVTIDGPAGSGKSTVSLMLAEKLNLTMLTTGSFYRGLALLCVKKGVETSDHARVVELVRDPGFQVRAGSSGTEVFLDGVNVTPELHNEETARLASQVSAIPEVRAALLGPQRSFMKAPGLVAEGRDCGTVVFPDAQVKIFLTANLDTRASRRSAKSTDAIAARDNADTKRKVSPLAKATNAFEIDTSDLSANQVVEKIVEIVHKSRS